jgi:hypothetical protein
LQTGKAGGQCGHAIDANYFTEGPWTGFLCADPKQCKMDPPKGDHSEMLECASRDVRCWEGVVKQPFSGLLLIQVPAMVLIGWPWNKWCLIKHHFIKIAKLWWALWVCHFFALCFIKHRVIQEQ